MVEILPSFQQTVRPPYTNSVRNLEINLNVVKVIFIIHLEKLIYIISDYKWTIT